MKKTKKEVNDYELTYPEKVLKGQELKELRLGLGLNQSQASKKANEYAKKEGYPTKIMQCQISYIENADRNYTINALCLYELFLNSEINKLK